jgi:polyphosphate kinase
VLVELKARFDEAHKPRARAHARARRRARRVRRARLKTHTKLAFAVREEGGVLRRYCPRRDGNYNPVTAGLYEDIGLLTSREEVTRDVAELFQRLTSGSGSRSYEKLLVAPEGLRAGCSSGSGARRGRAAGSREGERALRSRDHRRALRGVGARAPRST